MNPIISVLYKYFLVCSQMESFSRRAATLAFLFQGFGRNSAVNFVLNIAKNQTELKIVASNVKRFKDGNTFINWEGVNKDLER